jgi:hypothetical protein
MDKITLKNVSSATVVVSLPDIRFNRTLAPGRIVTVEKDIYEEMMFDTGIQNLLRAGYIRFDGVPEDEETVVVEDVLEYKEIEKMIDDRDITAFAKFIPNATMAEKETVVKYAVDSNVTDNAFTALIKKYCGVDVINAIAIKHQAEEK